tara:strand:+ start:163 stop:972 length:810 start_codon:yes stop_codon:yes gene_type:complete
MKKSRKTRKEMKLQRVNLREKRKRKRDVERHKKSSSFMIENLEKEISKPSSVWKYGKGNKVRLYHFTHPLCVKGILQNGLDRGYVWMEQNDDSYLGKGKGDDLTCVPCMTSNPIGSNNGQSNHTGNQDKELIRFSFLIDKDDPKLKEYPLWFWNECKEYGNDPISSYKYYQIHNISGNNNIQSWFVYLDIVRPEMIESVYLKSSEDGKYYDSNELQTWSWKGSEFWGNGLRYNDLPDTSKVNQPIVCKYNIYKDYTGYLENTKPEHWKG